MKHLVHVALEASTDVVGVHGGDAVARDVVDSVTAAYVLFESLQPAVGKLLSPAAAGVVENIDVMEVIPCWGWLQSMPNAAFDNHRPVECFAVKGEQHVMIGNGLPKSCEHGRFFGVVAGE